MKATLNVFFLRLYPKYDNKYWKVVYTNYYNAHYNLLPEYHYTSIENYIKFSMMDRVGSWRTDLEILLAAKVLRTDIFVYNHFGTDFQLMVSTTNVLCTI